MAQLIVITDTDTALGFRLAGLDVPDIVSANEATEQLLSLLQGKEPNVVIYNEEYRQALSEKSRALLDESLTPVFFPISTRQIGQIGESREVSLARMLRRVIGYQLKITR